jgi:hypothetical protein
VALRKAGASSSAATGDSANPPLVGPGQVSPSKALLAYNALRGLLLVSCLGIGYLAGLRGLLLIVVALAVSGLASWFLLKNQRIKMGMAVEQAVARGRGVMAERTAKEDEYADAVLARQAAEDKRQT